MAKDIGMTICKGNVVSFLPCLVAFWGFHPFMFFHFFKCFFCYLHIETGYVAQEAILSKAPTLEQQLYHKGYLENLETETRNRTGNRNGNQHGYVNHSRADKRLRAYVYLHTIHTNSRAKDCTIPRPVQLYILVSA